MERGLILLVAALIVFMAPGVRGTAHLSFANNETQVNITRAGCGDTKLCVDTPDGCNLSGNGNCLFASVIASTPVAPNGTELKIELRGDSEGYVALGLTVDASQGNTMLFICAQNSSDNGTFFFRTRDRNNTDNKLTPSETRVTEIRGMVKDNVIKCEFNVPNINATNSRTSHVTTFNLLVGRGSVDGNTLGAFNVSLNSGPLNLADPASNVATTPKPTTAMASTVAMTTASSAALQPYAVLLLLSVLTLSVTLTP
ncbi:putative ferric-chelate reductase 1 [Pempheris klunzingeri]|uniref:putative ferric-chelate reductase 1 n=1 Tax=Pempheris klunzingeri TaxID=3127111 RepID=UPI00398134D9